MLCAGIAAAGGNCVDAAAWSVVAEIGSSKRMEGVSAVSANSPRYRGCCGCRARRAAPAQVPAVRRCRNLHWWRRVEASSANPKPNSSLHKIGPLLHVATPVAKSNMDMSIFRTEIWFWYLYYSHPCVTAVNDQLCRYPASHSDLL